MVSEQSQYTREWIESYLTGQIISDLKTANTTLNTDPALSKTFPENHIYLNALFNESTNRTFYETYRGSFQL